MLHRNTLVYRDVAGKTSQMVKMNQWSDDKDGVKQQGPGSEDIPQREEREMPDDQGERKPDTEGQPSSMNSHSGQERKEGAGSTLQGDQERQTPEKEHLHGRTGNRGEIRNTEVVHAFFTQNLFLLT